ncbi:hypothetical protein M446_4089 [Methylobacterium sp. 4-46]|uniref:hypothetical protein n=1 Tax=unclassified Methylobacterium TaxID=2615210 RepID=UPI000152DDBC|nr:MULTISPECIES: hypothetical protein [Methylobacterium]ACA18447.1 hypothetical protein M446_4089 [Methylobacterium sp. 4-46]WFT77738.1 hypothetical protein QA634_20780 [Methylobacterium nodulans]
MAEKMGKASRGDTGINPKVLDSLVRKCEGIKGEMDECRGELGAAIKDAEEAHGVHRKAFKQMIALRKMDEAARADYLRAFDDYREKLGLNAQADMFDEPPRASADPGAKQAAENVERLKGMKTAEPVH